MSIKLQKKRTGYNIVSKILFHIHITFAYKHMEKSHLDIKQFLVFLFLLTLSDFSAMKTITYII